MVQVRTARVVATRALSPSVQGLSLAFDDGPLAFTAGQWLHLHVPAAHGIEKRAYSIASGPGAVPLELAVTHVADGAASPLLCKLDVGATLQCDGPHGFFTRDAPAQAQPALFVGTGTGLCPLRSMLTEILATPDHPPMTLLFGVRTQADILYREELTAWAARDPRFRLEVTLSRPSRMSGRTGYVQTHVAELARALDARTCSSAAARMVGEVRALCKSELGLDVSASTPSATTRDILSSMP